MCLIIHWLSTKNCGKIITLDKRLILDVTDNAQSKLTSQRAKKLVSDSLGPVDFALGLVNSVLNLPNGQVIFFEEFKLKKNCEINSASQQAFTASWNDV